MRAATLRNTAVSCWLTAALLFCTVHNLRADENKAAEYEIKAAFLYNLAKFVEWPANRTADEGGAVVFSILGKNPFGPALGAIEDKTLNGRKIVVREIKDLQTPIGSVLFICASEKERLPQILDMLDQSDILTVSDTPGFAEQGVMINLYTEDKKIRFEINADAADRCGLKISSKLLKLARIVQTPFPRGSQP